MTDQQSLAVMPAPYDFMFRTPLYDAYVVSDVAQLHQLLYFDQRFDAYCTACASASLFERIQAAAPDPTPKIEIATTKIQAGWRNLGVRCIRNPAHTYTFWFLIHAPNIIQKAGQYPSVADLHVADIRKYKKLLGQERTRELSRADGLAAHGIGIGSFVYLRRIFESLIEEARTQARGADAFDDAAFESGRMEDRILLLKDWLPEFLVENRSLYGILSKGIHELSEGECREYFGVVRTGIEIILDAQVEAAARTERMAKASEAIAAAKAKLKG